MTREELERVLRQLNDEIVLCRLRSEQIIQQYIKDNAKFKPGDRVCQPGHWVYGLNDGKHDVWIDELYATVDESYASTYSRSGFNVVIHYALVPDPGQLRWKNYGRLYREEGQLVPAAQVRIT